MRNSRDVKQPGEPLSVLTVTEAGHRLGISRSLAYRAIHDGEIPSVRIGRRLLVPKLALERMLSRLPGDHEFSADPAFAGSE